MIMAGGKGSRLGPLTIHRSKPGVPFAGRYRIIDFVLSNFINSGYRKIYVLTQYMSSSLIKHLSRNWRLSGFGEYIEVVPAQMRLGEFWYRGTADAVYQNMNLVRDARANHVAIFGGDHIYKFAVDQMDAQHRARDADLTVAAFPVPTAEASAFGIIDVDTQGRITSFIEKPPNPPEMPGRPGWSLVSMGNYIFRREVLEHVFGGAQATGSSTVHRPGHDFGKRHHPAAARQRRARVRATTSRRTRSPARPKAWRRTGVMSGRSTRTSWPTWSCGRGCRRSTCTTGSGGSAAPSATTRPRASSAPARVQGRARSTTAWCARARSSRRPRSGTPSSATTASSMRAR